MNQNKLERSVEQYLRKIIKAHEAVRSRAALHDGKRKKFWDIPRVAVVCCANKNKSYKGYSNRINSNSYDNTPALKEALLRLLPEGGKIGQTGDLCPYPVGHCAEPHAAHECIREEEVNLTSIHFSTARIVVTGEIKLYCQNCKHTFPTLS